MSLLMSDSFQTFNSVTIKTNSTLVIHVQLNLYSTVIEVIGRLVDIGGIVDHHSLRRV
jgi:hypothetical protein